MEARMQGRRNEAGRRNGKGSAGASEKNRKTLNILDGMLDVEEDEEMANIGKYAFYCVIVVIVGFIIVGLVLPMFITNFVNLAIAIFAILVGGGAIYFMISYHGKKGNVSGKFGRG